MSWNPKSIRCWKFQLSIFNDRKDLYLKKYCCKCSKLIQLATWGVTNPDVLLLATLWYMKVKIVKNKRIHEFTLFKYERSPAFGLQTLLNFPLSWDDHRQSHLQFWSEILRIVGYKNDIPSRYSRIQIELLV